MYKKVVSLLITVITVIAIAITLGYASTGQKFEEFFKEYSKDYVKQSLKVILTDTTKEGKGQALALLQLKGTGSIGLELFEKDEKGYWKYTQNARLKFDKKDGYRVMKSKPYYFAGTLQDKNIKKVFVGGEEVLITELGKNLRIWYVVSDAKDNEVIAHYTDGTKKPLDKVVDVK
jgi:hypothetical protein